MQRAERQLESQLVDQYSARVREQADHEKRLMAQEVQPPP